MTRAWTLLGLTAALVVAGCANPADDKYKVTATAPKTVDDAPSPPPTAGANPATSDKGAPPISDAAAPAVGGLAIAPEGSKIEFIGSKVTGQHHGGFKSFSGAAGLTPDQGSLAKLAVDVDMNSTWSDDEKLTGHLKAPDFFDVAKFPKATFVTTEIKPGGEKGATHTVTGNLTLHGVTKSISFPATVAVKDGGFELNSEFALNRKDFGIVYPGKTDDLIRDEVVLKIAVKAPKKV